MNEEQKENLSPCQTVKQLAPWIAFDIGGEGKEVEVGSVVLFKGNDEREGKIIDLDVRMTASLPEEGETKFTDGTLLGSFNGTEEKCQRILIKSTTPRKGRYVFIQKNPDGTEDHLSFQEVLIFGPSQDLPGIYKLK